MRVGILARFHRSRATACVLAMQLQDFPLRRPMPKSLPQELRVLPPLLELTAVAIILKCSEIVGAGESSRIGENRLMFVMF